MTSYSQTNRRAGPALSADGWHGGGESAFDACCQGSHSCSLNPSLCPRCHGPVAAHRVDSSSDGRCCHLSPVVYHQPFIPKVHWEAFFCFWPCSILLICTSLICFGQQPRTHFYYLFVGGAEDKGECGETRGRHGNVYRTSLPVPQIPILLQAYSSAFSHLSSTHFAPQVVFVGVGSEVRDPEGKGKIQTVSLWKSERGLPANLAPSLCPVCVTSWSSVSNFDRRCEES